MPNSVYNKHSTFFFKHENESPNLLKIIFQKRFIFHIFIVATMIFSPLCYSVLSATTNNVLVGTPPYFTFDGGITKTLSTEGLLGITLSDGTFIIPKINPAFPTATPNKSTTSTPIEFPVLGQTFADIKTNIPTDVPVVSDNDLTQRVDLNTFMKEPYNYWTDADGDADASATGTLNLSIKDSIGTQIKRTDKLDACSAPYSLTLNTTGGVLSTLYGFPKSAEFLASSATYYFKPKTNKPYVCNVQPNLNKSRTSSYDGPISQWSAEEGFKIQNLNVPGSNFPTMGAYGLHFRVILKNAKGVKVYSSKSSSKSKIHLSITRLANVNGEPELAAITLLGPKSDEDVSQLKFIPTTFTLYSDKEKTNVIYKFTLKQWFIVNSSPAKSYSDAKNYCESLGYRLASIAELTNANTNGWQGGLKGQGNNYQRRISVNDSSKVTPTNPLGTSGGLFAEWGDTNITYYFASFFRFDKYWASESININGDKLYPLVSSEGSISFEKENYSNAAAACVSP